MTEDALGSVRVTTGSFGEIKSRRDFLPFGEELYAGLAGRNANQKYSSSTDDTRKKFATYQRDIETGLDFAQSRYYSPMHGRFTSPDEFKGGPDELFDFEEDASDNPTFYADLENPQSLNKYQYGYNNPYKYTDPTGHCPLGICVWGPPASRAADRLMDAALRTAQATGIAAAATAVVTAVDGHVRRKGGIDPDNTAAGRYARTVESGQPQAWQIRRPSANVQQAAPTKASTGSATATPPPPNPSRKRSGQTTASDATKKRSKVPASQKTETIGGKFTKTTKVSPGRGPGQSRSEIVSIKNRQGRTIRTYKDSYDRANKWQHRKPLRGGPEGRPQN